MILISVLYQNAATSLTLEPNLQGLISSTIIFAVVLSYLFRLYATPQCNNVETLSCTMRTNSPKTLDLLIFRICLLNFSIFLKLLIFSHKSAKY